jgi:hypothetical protein
MKHVARFFSLIVLVGAGLFYASCDGDGGTKSEEELQLDKLKSTWTIQSVDNDATDRTDEYPGMTVTLSGTFSEGGTYNYSSDADTWPSVSPWKAIDTWKFKAGSIGSAIVRQSDLQEMTYALSESDKKLQVDFNYQGPGFNNARTQSVTGNWTFVFTRP